MCLCQYCHSVTVSTRVVVLVLPLVVVVLLSVSWCQCVTVTVSVSPLCTKRYDAYPGMHRNLAVQNVLYKQAYDQLHPGTVLCVSLLPCTRTRVPGYPGTPVHT
jgi:hypothetical protein